MYVARILYPVKVLGPGLRVGIWFAGCRHFCRGCSNPELWEFGPEYRTSVDAVMQMIGKIHRQHPVEGFTVTGGEPFEQAEELAGLAVQLTAVSADILIYSGYTLHELTERADPFTDDILRRTAVLIDGRYQEERNENCRLRGSSNQTIHMLNDSYQGLYREYLEQQENEIQNFMASDGIISVGIHRNGFKEALDEGLQDRGLTVLDNGGRV